MPSVDARHISAWFCWSADLGFRDSDAKGENASVVALPPGNWYKLNTTTTVKGDAVLQETLAITEFPVRAVPIARSSRVAKSRALFGLRCTCGRVRS